MGIIVGGHSGFQFGRGIKYLNVPVVAFCSCGDDGGSSKYPREYGLLPPGDFWKLIMGASRYKGKLYEDLASVLFYRFDNDGPIKGTKFGYLTNIACSDREMRNKRALDVLYNILPPDYRFKIEFGNGTKNHTLGNLVLAALMLENGNIQGIDLLERGLNSVVHCIPVSEKPYSLHVTTINGDSVIGEHSLDEDKIISPVQSVRHSASDGGRVYVNPEVLETLSKLRRLSLCATSMVANIWGMMLPEIREYVARASFPIDYWPPLMTEQNQTHYVINGRVVSYNFTQHVVLATEIVGRVPDVVIAHDYALSGDEIPRYIQLRYARKNATPVQCTEQDEITLESVFRQSLFNKVPTVLRRNLATVDIDRDKGQRVIRHKPSAIRSAFEELLKLR